MTTKQLCQKINEAGWIAFYHPRKKTVSINGGRQQKELEARKRMFDMLSQHESMEANIPY